MPSVSIIICTVNRGESLRKTLAAMGDMEIPAGMTVEVIVADNGSSDGTAEIVTKCRQENANVRYVSEPVKGQSRARNRGIAEAGGEIIVFTDDDVIPAWDWLVKLCAPLVNGEADAVVGCVRLAPELNAPWMTVAHREWVADTGGMDPKNPARMVGANMAFKRNVLERVTAYDIELGPGALGFGDDTLFSQQIKEAGYRLAMVSDAVVEHHFQADRLAPQAWSSSAKRLGQVDAYISHHWEHDVWPNPGRMVCIGLVQLARRQLEVAIGKSTPVGMDYLLAVRSLHARLHYLSESKKPRKYERHGLVKLSSGASDAATMAKETEMASTNYPVSAGRKV
jgi:glycosyltransferase involved in cell wall biosynthesis